jgi:hypothetical protein
VTITKKDHSSKICEAFWEKENQWFAAYVIDVDEANQKAEI